MFSKHRNMCSEVVFSFVAQEVRVYFIWYALILMGRRKSLEGPGTTDWILAEITESFPFFLGRKFSSQL